jgi:hypothetical protein
VSTHAPSKPRPVQHAQIGGEKVARRLVGRAPRNARNVTALPQWPAGGWALAGHWPAFSGAPGGAFCWAKWPRFLAAKRP